MGVCRPAEVMYCRVARQPGLAAATTARNAAMLGVGLKSSDTINANLGTCSSRRHIQYSSANHTRHDIASTPPMMTTQRVLW